MVIASLNPTFCNSSTALLVGATASMSLSGLEQPTPQFLERRRLAGPGRAADVHSPIARVEDKFDDMFLFRAQKIRGDERLSPPRRPQTPMPRLTAIDHFPLPLQARLGRDFIAVAQNRAGGFLRR